MANTWVLTLVPSLLMLFSWEAGWDNSFNKGYEQAAIGPTTGTLGIDLKPSITIRNRSRPIKASRGTLKTWSNFRPVMVAFTNNPVTSNGSSLASNSNDAIK